MAAPRTQKDPVRWVRINPKARNAENAHILYREDTETGHFSSIPLRAITDSHISFCKVQLVKYQCFSNYLPIKISLLKNIVPI
jgi:hypothetical protein